MKTTLSLLTLLLTFAASHSLYAAPGDNFTLDSTDGKISLSQYKGEIVYVDFWASWCIPCRKSFPWMNRMQVKYEKEGFKIIAITLDSNASATENFLKKTPALFTVAYDREGDVADNYNVQVMPTSYLIGRDGKILMTHKGFRSKHEAALEEEIKKALK